MFKALKTSLVSRSRNLSFLMRPASRWYRSITDLTTKVRTLKEFNEILWSFVNLSDDGFLLIDKYGIVVEVNDSACMMTGYPRAELIGKPITETLPPYEWPRFHILKDQILHSENTPTSEWDLRHKNGTSFRIKMNAKLLKNGQLQLLMQAIAPKQKPEHLPESQFRTIFENAYDALLVHDAQGTIIAANLQLHKTFGYSQSELIGKPMEILVPDKLQPIHSTLRAKYYESPYPRAMGSNSRLYGRKKDGSEIPVDIYLNTFHQDKSVFGCATIRDLAETKKQFEKVSFLSELSRTLSETRDYQDRIQIFAQRLVPMFADTCIVSILENDKLTLKAIASEDPQKKDFIQALAFHYRPTIDNQFTADSVLENMKPVFVERLTEGPTPNNEIEQELLARMELFQINGFVILPLISRGKEIGVMTLSMTKNGHRFDRCDLPFFEAVASRCAVAVENARLSQEKDAALRSRELVLSLVSHDLKNPLTIIDLAGQALLGSKLVDEERKNALAQKIRNSTAIMQRMIGDLLLVGKIQSGTLAIQPSENELSPIIEAALAAHQNLAKQRGLSISIQNASVLPPAFIDPDRITQVLWNLIGNAVKFTPPGGSIIISTRLVGKMIEVSVSDTGPGIPENELPKVFESFWQAKKTAGLGTGLGLAIAKGLVQAHGGDIWVESKTGQGSRFFFTVGIAPDKKDELPKEKCSILSNFSEISAAPSLLNGVHIQLVDDSADSLTFLKVLLERVGATCNTCLSIEEALSGLSSNKPDLLITDIEMPDGDGYKLLKEVRSLESAQETKVPVIALTGHSDEEELKKMAAAGFVDHLPKPVPLELLISAVTRALHRS